MGMINRVRARIQTVTLPASGCKTETAKQIEDRQTKTACIMSAVLLVPYFARLPSPILITSVTVAYFLVVMPMLLAGNPLEIMVKSKRFINTKAKEAVKSATDEMKKFSIRMIKFWSDVISTVKHIINGIIDTIVTTVKFLFLHFMAFKDRIEKGFLKMKNISTMINQLMFFMMCDRFFCPRQKLTCLYSLMFFNVGAYCVAYVKQLITNEDWSPYVTISDNANVKHLAMTATKLVLELTKAVTFIITVVFMLLVFGLEQGLEQFNPSYVYTFITALFYVFTEKVFTDNFSTVLEYMEIELMEGLEVLWSPVILKLATGSLSVIFALLAFFVGGDIRFFILALYINTYLPYKDFKNGCWSLLEKERRMLRSYRFATSVEVKECDDVCAVCLQNMTYFARVTPCNHFFHGNCLRMCLKQNNRCPMCKRSLFT